MSPIMNPSEDRALILKADEWRELGDDYKSRR